MSCNKCREDKCTCTTDACNPIDAKCVIYQSNGDPSDLNCIAPIEPKTSLKEILETWDRYFCGLFEVAVLDCAREELQIAPQITTLSNSALLTYIQHWICNLEDKQVKVSPSDTRTGYLVDKIDKGDCVILSTVTDEVTGEQKLKISLDFACIAGKIPLCFNIEPQQCITIDCTSCGGGECTPQPLTPVISRIGLQLTGTNCNGNLQWYDANETLIGTGNSITGEPNKTYHAKCLTTCGLSSSSNKIAIPNITTYTKVRTATFTRNNCGVNECNVACTGSSTTFTRTYTSTISQADADAKAETDTTFALDGQAYANTVGTCVCSDCNCVFPTWNPSIIVNNSTCNGSVVVANGQILIGGISNATRFGYSIGAGDYAGVSYASAISLNNYNSSNIETTPTSIKLKAISTETRFVFRLFNENNTCFKDIVVVHTPSDCTKEQISIGDITVSCEIEEVVCKNWTVTAGTVAAEMVFFNCNTKQYVFESVQANGTVYRCSTIKPEASGAVITENGIC